MTFCGILCVKLHGGDTMNEAIFVILNDMDVDPTIT